MFQLGELELWKVPTMKYSERILTQAGLYSFTPSFSLKLPLCLKLIWELGGPESFWLRIGDVSVEVKSANEWRKFEVEMGSQSSFQVHPGFSRNNMIREKSSNSSKLERQHSVLVRGGLWSQTAWFKSWFQLLQVSDVRHTNASISTSTNGDDNRPILQVFDK